MGSKSGVFIASSNRLLRESIARMLAKKTDFEVVALERQDRLPDFCQSILQSHPQVNIIAVAPDPNSTVFYWASLRVQANQI